MITLLITFAILYTVSVYKLYIAKFHWPSEFWIIVNTIGNLFLFFGLFIAILVLSMKYLP
jgi:hypothetical protein